MSPSHRPSSPSAPPTSSPTPTGGAAASFASGGGQPSPTPVASTAAGLNAASLPRPSVLGTGWRYRIGGTDAEDGFAGNGTPASVIEPREIVQTVLPFGCVKRPALPLPTAALSVEYASGATRRAVAVRLRFRAEPSAAAFLSRWRTAAQECAAQPKDPVSGRVAPLRGLHPVGTAWVSERQESDDVGNPVGYTEWKVQRGHDVLLLAVQQAPSTASPGAGNEGGVAAALSRLLGAS